MDRNDPWARWRVEFPILARKNYLNSCSLGALSRTVEARVGEFHAEWHERGASAWYDAWIDRCAELRGRVATMIGARPEEVGLAASTSAALAVLASALDYRRRPRVVVTDLDFPTMAYPWMVRPDIEVVRVPSDDGATIDLRRIAEAVDDRTALVATSHVFFATGAIQDLAALSTIAHSAGALLLVDAYQSAGQVPIDVARDGVDILTAGPLKWLLGGPGLAYLFVRDELIPRLRPTVAGWFGARNGFDFDIARFQFHDDARRFELGTPALHTVHAALGGQDIIDRVGVPDIRRRNAALTERLIRSARDAGFELRCAGEPACRSAIVMVRHADPAAAVRDLAERDIIVDWRPGCVRVSPHFYNSEDDVDAFVEALTEVSRP